MNKKIKLSLFPNFRMTKEGLRPWFTNKHKANSSVLFGACRSQWKNTIEEHQPVTRHIVASSEYILVTEANKPHMNDHLFKSLNMQWDSCVHRSLKIKHILQIRAYKKRARSKECKWNMYEMVYTVSLQWWSHPLRGFACKMQSPGERLWWPYEGWRMVSMQLLSVPRLVLHLCSYPSSSGLPALTPPCLDLKGVTCDMNSNFPKWSSTITMATYSIITGATTVAFINTFLCVFDY